MLKRASVMMCAALLLAGKAVLCQQDAPAPTSARILLLPKRVVTGERATLAVLDGNGRLTPGVQVNFSNGERALTDATGRARFTAPTNAGVIYATLGNRSERVYTTILTHAEAPSGVMEVSLAPRFISLADRFELSGSGFCGDADANSVRIAGEPAFVLASSPAFLAALPPAELTAGSARVELTCANRSAAPFAITFLDLTLNADGSPLAPGQRRALTVHVIGTDAKVPLEARNLAPRIAGLMGGNVVTISSAGGAANSARFEVTGRERGNFQVAIRVVPELVHPGEVVGK